MRSLLNKAINALRSDGYLKPKEQFEVEAEYREGHEFHTTLLVREEDTRKIYADFRVTKGNDLEVADVSVDRF